MILIRDRDELRRHLENLRDAADAEAFAERKHSRRPLFPSGRSHGLNEAIEAIDAWETFDESQATQDSTEGA